MSDAERRTAPNGTPDEDIPSGDPTTETPATDAPAAGATATDASTSDTSTSDTTATATAGPATGADPGASGGPGGPGDATDRSSRLRSLRSLSRAMVLGLLRDRTAAFFTLLFPVMFLVIFGALFKDQTTPQSSVVQVGQVAVLDQMPDDAKQQLRDVLKIEKTDGSAAAREDALREVREGDKDAAITQSGDRVVVHYSSVDQVRAGTVQGVIDSLVQQANQRATGQPPAFTLASEQVEDESVQPIQFLTPGLLGWAVALGATFSSALTLVNWRKKRILRRLRLAPVSPGTVVAARVGVSLAMALAQLVIFLAIAVTPYYGLQLTGGWWWSIPLVACGTLAFMSIGLLVGSWAKSEEAANGLLQVTIMPMAFLSGSFFPLDATPSWVQALSQVLPLRHLNDAMQDVLSRGQGWSAALPTMGGLLLFAVVVTAIAGRLFRWEDA